MAITSPSKMISPPPTRWLTSSTTSGTLSVTSESLRLKTRVSLSLRWIWIRAPSYLYSNAVSPPCTSMASAASSVMLASIGFSGTNRLALILVSPSSPCDRATSATLPRSPVIIRARRTTPRGASPASAMASSITPSLAPILISPKMIRTSMSVSLLSADVSSPSISCSLSLLDPGPDAAATLDRIPWTFLMVSRLLNRVVWPPWFSTLRTVLHPTSRLLGSNSGKTVPINKSTDGATSSGSSFFRNSAIRAVFSFRFAVASKPLHSAASPLNSVSGVAAASDVVCEAPLAACGAHPLHQGLHASRAEAALPAEEPY